MPRPLLTNAQCAALFDHPTTEKNLIRSSTLPPIRTYSARLEKELVDRLLPAAVMDDRPIVPADTILTELRRRRIVLPAPTTVERLCRTLRHLARQEVHRKLVDGLSHHRRQQPEALLALRPAIHHSQLAWLLQAPTAARGAALLGVLERLAHVRRLGLPAHHGRSVPPNRLRQFAREGARTTVQHLAETTPLRRLATLTAVALDLI